MLPSLSLLHDSLSRRRSSLLPSRTDLLVVLEDSASRACTLHNVYIITNKFTSRSDGYWGIRYRYLIASFSAGIKYEPVNYVNPYIITDQTLAEEVSHLNAYGRYLFACGSRSTHMTYSYRAALGCALAHLRVWNSIVNCSRDFCLVVEDNVYFGEGTSATLSFYEKKFRELNADYLMLHTLGPFQDYCEATERKQIGSVDVEYDVPFREATVTVKEKLYELDRPMMSTKCYLISKRFARYMYDMLYDMHEVNQMPAIHIDALLSLEALRGQFRAFHRFQCTAPATQAESSIFDNVDYNRSFVGILKKADGQGIPHTTPVASRGTRSPE